MKEGEVGPVPHMLPPGPSGRLGFGRKTEEMCVCE